MSFEVMPGSDPQRQDPNGEAMLQEAVTRVLGYLEQTNIETQAGTTDVAEHIQFGFSDIDAVMQEGGVVKFSIPLREVLTNEYDFEIADEILLDCAFTQSTQALAVRGVEVDGAELQRNSTLNSWVKDAQAHIKKELIDELARASVN
jgi:hypothetical protein